MGTYLSKPVTEKSSEAGDDLEDAAVPLVWGVVDMQGWRKTMEDAHIAHTNLSLQASDTKAKCFAIFDGHGGPEAARFCQLYLPSVLQQHCTDALSLDVGNALVETFHAMDRMMEDPNRREELRRLRSIPPSPGEHRHAENIPPKVVLSLTKLPVVHESSKDTVVTCTPGGVIGTTATTIVAQPNDNSSNNADDDDNNNNTTDDDSLKCVGKEQAMELDGELASTDNKDEAPIEAGKVSSLFSRLFMGLPESGQLVLDGNEVVMPQQQQQQQPTVDASAPPPTGPSATTPSVLCNGRMICNLPDHPIHAGATAIVAVLVGRTLWVANAGDSRAVLCRAGGAAVPLSLDHKPMQERELMRIHKAGGFVNNFGRVNGNLNLSRSIGDLKYKQGPGLELSEQMITAEPDIVKTVIEPTDEFLVLGCDGIWDCLTSAQAVEYVRSRMDTKSPVDIGTELLNDILSQDPRATQGIGGDNMTVMIIDFQPHSRGYRQGSTNVAATPSSL